MKNLKIFSFGLALLMALTGCTSSFLDILIIIKKRTMAFLLKKILSLHLSEMSDAPILPSCISGN